MWKSNQMRIGKNLLNFLIGLILRQLTWGESAVRTLWYLRSSVRHAVLARGDFSRLFDDNSRAGASHSNASGWKPTLLPQDPNGNRKEENEALDLVNYWTLTLWPSSFWFTLMTSKTKISGESWERSEGKTCIHNFTHHRDISLF